MYVFAYIYIYLLLNIPVYIGKVSKQVFMESRVHSQLYIIHPSIYLPANQVGTAAEASRLLKFAKANTDVLDQLRMITAFDAGFCSRSDGSSQGGYFEVLANSHVLESGEDTYTISWT